MSGEFELVTLRNGARAVRHRPSGEVMHPSVGPWREANLLYVEQGRVAERLEEQRAEPLVIWDVGLGAATNAVAALSVAASGHRRPLSVVSFERDLEPLALALDDAPGFPYLVPWREAARTLADRGEWHEGPMSWRLVRGELPGTFDRLPAELVFFDPFSPDTNPSLWTPDALAKLRIAAEHPAGTLLMTYSAATRTRVSLLMAGFFVGEGAGVGTKRETTLAATRLELLERPLGVRWLERWRRSSARAPHGSDEVPDLEAHPQFVVRKH